MRIAVLFIGLVVGVCLGQDENSEDVFDRPLLRDMEDMVPREETNEGSDAFPTSTEMIEMTNDTSLEVKAVEKTFQPITPLESSAAVFNFSQATIEEDSMEEEDDSEEAMEVTRTTRGISEDDTKTTTEINVITFSPIPIVPADEVANRRVLKEKEQPTNRPKVETTTSARLDLTSDPSELDENETPFDQTAFEGLFEQDGSVIDTSLNTSPAFPILKMEEEDSKILSKVPIPSLVLKNGEARKEQETTTTTTSTEATTEAETTSAEIETPSTEESISSTELATLENSSKVFLPSKAIRTPITFRITSLEFVDEFNDLTSGPSKKLSKDLVTPVTQYISSISATGNPDDDNLISVELRALTKGSVVVAADVLTRKSLGDPQMSANLLEAAIAKNGSIIGEYVVDSLSVTVDGVTSQAYIDSISTQHSARSYSLSSLMIVIVALSIVVIVGVAILIIMITTKKRRNASMKMSLEDTMRSITPESNDTPHAVHLMSYGQRMSQKPPSPINKTQIDETNSSMY